MSDECEFCEVAAGRVDASVVIDADDIIAFMDLRQFHPGHVLVIPRAHVADLRELPSELAGPLLSAVAQVARAVSDVFPNEGLSVWHSIGEAAHQEVPHLHIHVHPRRVGDQMLVVYPSRPDRAGKTELDRRAALLRSALLA